jgi:roadblock/LC7 domain-containing protein
MKLLKLIAMGALIAGFSMTSAVAANGEFATKGKKLYVKRIKKQAHLTGVQLLKALGITSKNKAEVKAQLDDLFANKAAKLKAKLKAMGNEKAAKAFSKLNKKKLEVIEDFLYILQTNPSTLGGSCS